MSEQNPNPDDEQPVFTKTEMNAIVQQRLQQDRARRGNPPPASSSSSTAAPAASGDDRLSRVEATLDRMASMFERLQPPAPSTSTPQSAPTVDPAVTSRPPAAAPSAPSQHTLPTNMGFPDIWNMTPEQFVQFRNAGELRPTLEKMWAAGARAQGAPTRPSTPWSLDSAGNPVANPRYRGR